MKDKKNEQAAQEAAAQEEYKGCGWCVYYQEFSATIEGTQRQEHFSGCAHCGTYNVGRWNKFEQSRECKEFALDADKAQAEVRKIRDFILQTQETIQFVKKKRARLEQALADRAARKQAEEAAKSASAGAFEQKKSAPEGAELTAGR